jgi:predicted PurR-regulated permease PerM
VTERPDTSARAAQDAAEQASDAADRADEAADRSDTAADRSGSSADRSGSAANRSGSAADRSGTAAGRAEAAEEQVSEEVLAADLLLDGPLRELAAGVDDEHPLGKPGESTSGWSPFRIGFTGALGVGLAYALLEAVVATRQVLVLVLMAAFLAVGLTPAVDVVARKMRRGVAVTVVLGLVLLFLGGFVAAAAPPISKQATQLATNAPDYLDRLRANNSVVNDLDRRFHFIDSLKKRSKQGPTFGVGTVGGLVGAGKAVLSALFAVLTVFILTAYFLANYTEIKTFALRLVPRSRRPRVGLIADEALSRVGGYVLGNLATSVIAGVTTLIFLEIIRMPYAVALSLFVAIMDLVPLVGATIAAVLVSALAFFQSIPAGIAAIVFFLIYQQLENYVLVPRIMKRTADVSPLVTVIAALIGGTLLGIVGALLAIPVAAAAQIIIAEVVVPRQDEA